MKAQKLSAPFLFNKERAAVTESPDNQGLAIQDDEAEMQDYCIDLARSRRDEEFD